MARVIVLLAATFVSHLYAQETRRVTSVDLLPSFSQFRDIHVVSASLSPDAVQRWRWTHTHSEPTEFIRVKLILRTNSSESIWRLEVYRGTCAGAGSTCDLIDILGERDFNIDPSGEHVVWTSRIAGDSVTVVL